MSTKTYTLRQHSAAVATKPTKTKSTQAQAAQMIRADLKAAFPSVTFRVKSRGFSGGDAIDIDWTDGPNRAEVEAVVGKYEYGSFDGMQDLYEYTNVRKDIPQAKYVQTNRRVSSAATLAAVAYLNKHYGYSIETVEHPATQYHVAWVDVLDGPAMLPTNRWASNEVNSLANGSSMLCRHCAAHTLPGDAFCPDCGHVLGCDACKLPFLPLRENHDNSGLCWSCHYDKERATEEADAA